MVTGIDDQVDGAVNLVDVQSDGGIHAPSLRCKDGRYYLITTNVYSPKASGAPTQMVNFVITADSPQGPWSQPHVINGAPGIDPDLFFDDDGSVGTRQSAPSDAAYPGEGEIWLQRLDPQTWQLVGERHFLWRGALKRAIWAEGPHLYKQDGRYYLGWLRAAPRLTTQSPLQSATSLRGPTRVMSAIRFSPRATLAMTTGLTAPDTLTFVETRGWPLVHGCAGHSKRRGKTEQYGA